MGLLLETQTTSGPVKGLPAESQQWSIYKGIPYAAPPVDDLRWRPPQPAKKMAGTLRGLFLWRYSYAKSLETRHVLS